MANTIAVLVFGYLLGAISTWVFIKYGINLAKTLIFEVKEDLPPESLKPKPFEQSHTDEYEEDEAL